MRDAGSRFAVPKEKTEKRRSETGTKVTPKANQVRTAKPGSEETCMQNNKVGS